MFKELTEHSLQNRALIVPVSDISLAPASYERYASLFSFDDNINSYVKVNNSVKKYGGIVYSEDLIIDVDCKHDPEIARNSAVQIVTYLNTEFNISPDDMSYYFSGAKGFHIYMPGKMFGGIEGSKDLPSYFKDFVLEMSGIDNVDTSIYEPVRLFRIPNSVNEKTGLYKIEISFEELQNLTINEIKELAAGPRIDFVRPKPLYSVTRNNLLSIHWNGITNKLSTDSIDYKVLVTDEDFFSPPIDGERNNKLFKQASMLFDLTDNKLHRKSVLQILRSINFASGCPVEEDELRAIVKSAEKKVERNGKIKPKQKVEWRTISELIPGYEALLLDNRAKLYTGFPLIDKEYKGMLRGKVVGIAGLGGTKKSLFAQQILNYNIENHGAKGIVNTAEMSYFQWLEREIDQLVEMPGYNASEVIKSYYDTDISIARDALYNDIGKRLGNSIFLSQNSRLNTDDYRNALIECANKAGKIDILLVDGLSLMEEGSKGETEATNKNTADLKELANEFDLLVMIIIHVTKNTQKTTRDLYDCLRGSQKIADNCDSLIYLSMIENISNPNDNVVEYLRDKTYVRLYNKRQSGNTVNIIADFNPRRLLLTETDENPLWHERSKKH